MASPNITKITMSFYDALKEVMGGQRITRLEWGNASIFGLLFNGHLSLHKDDGKYYSWIVNDGDMLAEDWITLANTTIRAA